MCNKPALRDYSAILCFLLYFICPKIFSQTERINENFIKFVGPKNIKTNLNSKFNNIYV